jgi:signal transduction histidine kinase
LLNARSATEQKKSEHLQRIERHVVLADGVVTALSSFAKMPVPNLQTFPLRPCLEEVLEINPVPPSCEVILDCPPSLPLILADLDQIRIVFGNLVRNAHEAMPQGGQLGIAASEWGEQVQVSVSDTGVGIPPDQLSRILEPLYSTKVRGLGLGLAIVRSILEKNHGSLRAASEPGRGSTFTVLLRAAQTRGGEP